MTYKRGGRSTPDSRGHDPTPIRQVLNDLFQEYRLSRKFKEKAIIHSWEKIMGKPIADRTTGLFFKNKILFVKLNSAPLKKELSMSKDRILQMIQADGGKDVINDLRFL